MAKVAKNVVPGATNETFTTLHLPLGGGVDFAHLGLVAALLDSKLSASDVSNKMWTPIIW